MMALDEFIVEKPSSHSQSQSEIESGTHDSLSLSLHARDCNRAVLETSNTYTNEESNHCRLCGPRSIVGVGKSPFHKVSRNGMLLLNPLF
jgi:hypothetical protein